MPEISVIIPCHNGFRYMEKCLKAFENQTFKDFEVIVIDDCSTDDSYAQLQNYHQHSALEMQLLQNEKNEGPGISRNKGIAAAKGDWIAFCDADDWYTVDFLEKMLQAAKENGADLVMCDDNYAFENGKTVKRNGMDWFDSQSNKNDFLVKCKMSLCRLFVKKSLTDEQLLPDLRHGEDAVAVIKLLNRAENITVLKEAYYNYFIRENSASNTPDVRVYSDFRKAYDLIEEELQGEYHTACEYQGIVLVLYSATLCAFKAGVDQAIIAQAVADFSKKYPEWRNNPYLGSMDKKKRIYLKLIQYRFFFGNKLYAWLHSKLLGV